MTHIGGVSVGRGPTVARRIMTGADSVRDRRRREKRARVRRVLKSNEHARALRDDEVGLAVAVDIRNCYRRDRVVSRGGIVHSGLEVAVCGGVLQQNRNSGAIHGAGWAGTDHRAQIGYHHVGQAGRIKGLSEY